MRSHKLVLIWKKKLIKISHEFSLEIVNIVQQCALKLNNYHFKV